MTPRSPQTREDAGAGSLDHWSESDSHGILGYDVRNEGYDQQSGQAATTKSLGTSPAETGGQWRVTTCRLVQVP